MRYAAFQTLILPARPSSHPARLLAGAGLTVLLFLALGFAYAGLMPLIFADIAEPGQQIGRGPPGVLLLLGQFACLIVALSIALRLVHRRRVRSLIGPARRGAAQFLRCALFLLPLYLALVFVPMPEPYRLSRNLAPGPWLAWLPLALPCIMIQVAAEELTFRGYLQSQLAARVPHPLVWIGLPSVLFGMLHYNTALAGETPWVLVVWAMLFGAAAADLTARAGTLGPALALHFVNNVFAILVTAPAGDLDGLALYTFPLDLATDRVIWTLLPMETLLTLCAWLVARLALRA